MDLQIPNSESMAFVLFLDMLKLVVPFTLGLKRICVIKLSDRCSFYFSLDDGYVSENLLTDFPLEGDTYRTCDPSPISPT